MKIRNYFQNRGNYYIGFILGVIMGYFIWEGSNNFDFGMAAGFFTWIIMIALLDIKDKIPRR